MSTIWEESSEIDPAVWQRLRRPRPIVSVELRMIVEAILRTAFFSLCRCGSLKRFRTCCWKKGN